MWAIGTCLNTSYLPRASLKESCLLRHVKHVKEQAIQEGAGPWRGGQKVGKRWTEMVGGRGYLWPASGAGRTDWKEVKAMWIVGEFPGSFGALDPPRWTFGEGSFAAPVKSLGLEARPKFELEKGRGEQSRIDSSSINGEHWIVDRDLQ